VEAARQYVNIVTVQNRYSLGDRRHEETLNWCQQQGIGFLPWYPNAGGKLLKADHPAALQLSQIAKRHGASVSQLSLSWLLQRSPVLMPIPGTSKVAHLEENVAASELKLSPEEWAEVETAANSATGS
jgi:aryl-alcohol dehydrogenase-like predicted oxidoreductase